MEGRCAVHARANGLGTDTWQDMSTTRPRPLRYAPEDAALLLSRLAQKESALRYAPSAEALLLSGASLCQAAALAADSPPRGGGGGAAGGGARPRRSAPRSRRESDGGAAARRASGPGQNAAPLRSEPARDLANRRAGRPLPYKALLQVSLPSQLSSSWTPLLGAVSEPSRNFLAGAARLSARRPPPVPGALCRPLPLPRHRRQKRVSASPLSCLLLGAFPEPSCRPRSARRGCVPRTRCGDTPPHSN